MKSFGMLFLLSCIFLPDSSYAQINAATTVAGVAAGASLSGASGQGGATPSSIGGGGGGSSPIEIQVMAYNGLQKIAKDVANITAKNQAWCTAASNGNVEKLEMETAVAGLKKEVDRLEEDKAARENPGQIERDEMRIEADIANFREMGKTAECEVLVEDPTSSNQLVLYHALEAYFDHLQRIHEGLQDVFALQIGVPSLSFSMSEGADYPPPQLVTVTNNGVKAFNVKVRIVPDDVFKVTTSDCSATPLDASKFCSISVSFNPPDKNAARKFDAALEISNDISEPVQRVQLSGEIKELTAEQLKARQDLEKKLRAQHLPEDKFNFTIKEFDAVQTPPAAAPAAAAAAAAGAGGGGGAPPTTPVGLTYLGDMMTALAGAKATNTYAPSSFQPTTQAFEVLVEAELIAKGLHPYTSTSALNVTEASESLNHEFGLMLAWASDVTNWTNQCKPPSGQPTTAGKTPPPNPACNWASVIVDLAVAQQLVTGYTALLSTANDGSGNPVIVDLLRGKVLSDKMDKGVPSLQVAVTAAGGSSKTNSPFFVGLFYQWAPSYDAGAIVTFELRGKNDELIESGARSVLYGYGKWNPGSFNHDELVKVDKCTFCSSK